MDSGGLDRISVRRVMRAQYMYESPGCRLSRVFTRYGLENIFQFEDIKVKSVVSTRVGVATTTFSTDSLSKATAAPPHPTPTASGPS